MRDRITRIRQEFLPGSIDPSTARTRLLTLTALFANCLQEIEDAEFEYHTVLLRHLDANEAANRAKIRAATTPEYRRLQQAKNELAGVEQLIAGAKYFLRSQEEEMRLSR